MKAVAKLAGAAAGLWAASEAYAKFTEKSLRDEVILITGGAGGIGKLMAEMAAREGAAVAIADISPGVHAVAEQLVKEGLRVKSYQFNITDMDAVNENCEKVASDFGGRVDVLINNAGVVSGKTLLENTPRAMNLTMQVNTISHFWTVRKLLPGMLERDHGRVVTIASAAGTVGTAGLADYCASKFGAFGFGEALRMELRNKKSKVRTTLVCPNFIRTPLFEGAKTKWPLILPILEPDYVAAKVIKAIKRDQPLLIMPRFTSLIFLTRGLLPVSWFDYAMDVLGISKSMDHFCGKSEGISK